VQFGKLFSFANLRIDFAPIRAEFFEFIMMTQVFKAGLSNARGLLMCRSLLLNLVAIFRNKIAARISTRQMEREDRPD